MLVIAAYAVCGLLQRLARLGIQRGQRTMRVLGRDFQRLHRRHIQPVKATGVLQHGGIAPGPHVGQDAGHHTIERRVLRSLERGQLRQRGIEAGGIRIQVQPLQIALSHVCPPPPRSPRSPVAVPHV